MRRSRLTQVATACSCALLLFLGHPATADDLQDINQLYKQGQQEKALDRVNSFLGSRSEAQGPRITQARFMKGLILADLGKTAEAIQVFTKLAEDYPELPEPYNNLAVLYAGQGNYDMARIALEMAIATNPSYATAHENLGDIYAKMASQAYDKALQLDKGSAPTPTKLAMVKELSGTGKGNRAPAKSEIARLLAAKPVASSPAAPVKATKPYTPPVPAAPPVRVATRTEPVKPVSPPSKPAPAPRKAEGKETSEAEAGVLRTLNAWTKAWSDKNAAGYLAHYARDFKTPKGENRSAWEKTRKERITRPKSIHVTAGSPQVKQIDATHASVTFRQIYKSDALQTSTWKTLVLVKSGERWFIQQERIGR